MNELMSIYLIMFYMSSLVRYKPAFIENLLNTKEAWLIDSFVKSCSVTFLRMIVSEIMNTDFVIKYR
jgi:hypothetical protein